MKKLHNNIFVAGQIQASDFEAFKQAGISTIINNRPDGEEPGQLTAAQAQALSDEHGMRYYYLPMVNGQALPEDLVDNFKNAIDQSDGNVLAHCRSGMRSSFIWALGAIADAQISVDEAIQAAQGAGIPLENARAVLETVQP